VNLSVDCSRRLAMMNSLMEKMNESSPTTASTGAASGRMIPQNTWAGVAPSTRADSSSESGIESRNPFISQVLMPSAPPSPTRMTLVRVSRPNAGKTSPIRRTRR